MDDNLRERVEEVIDGTIRSFDPKEPGSFELWDGELKNLEEQIKKVALPNDEDFYLSRLSAQRIVISSKAENTAFVLVASREFLDTYPPSNPNFFLVASIRARTLHLLENHKEEVREIMEIFRSPYLRGRELLLLLEGLARRHPGVIKGDNQLRARLQSAVDQLRAHGYEDLPPINDIAEDMDLEQLILALVDELRRIDQAYTESLLADEGK